MKSFLSGKQSNPDDSAVGPIPTEFHYEEGSCALEYWEPVKLLGEGSISDIHLVRRRSKRIHVRYKKKRDIMKFAKQNTATNDDDDDDSDSLYVLKSIMKDHVDNDRVLQEMRSELQTMSQLKHPNIVKLYEAYERRRHIYLVMDYCSGGDLTDRHFSEPECGLLVGKILSAVAYLHSHNVVHRDLKLENIMLDRDGEIKIIDFGLATKYLSDEHKNMTDRVGTLYTMAPQVLQGVYTSQCDLWSIGVISYMLLSGGVDPFWGPPRPMPWAKRRKVMIDRIMRCQYQKMAGPRWEHISPQAKQFVASLLQMDPDDRPTAQEALDSEWIQSCAAAASSTGLVSEEERQSRRALSRLRLAAIVLLAQELSEEEVIDLRNELEKYDLEGEGMVKLQDFQTVLLESTKLDSSRVADLFGCCQQLDMTSLLAYNDFCISVLASRDRSITEKTAEALDRLDTQGSRKVDEDELRNVLEGILSPELLEAILKSIEVDSEGMVSTVQVLEMLDKRLVNHTRHSLRTVGRQEATDMENVELVDETNALIPGGRTDNRQNRPKYIYEAKDKTMHKIEEYEA